MMKEGELKLAIEEYLQYGQNQGKWMFLRLNAGDFIEVRGNTRRRIKGCPKGTADFFVLTSFQCGLWIPRPMFLELKSHTGKQTKEQKEFQEMVTVHCAGYYIIRSVEELMEILNEA